MVICITSFPRISSALTQLVSSSPFNWCEKLYINAVSTSFHHVSSLVCILSNNITIIKSNQQSEIESIVKVCSTIVSRCLAIFLELIPMPVNMKVHSSVVLFCLYFLKFTYTTDSTRGMRRETWLLLLVRGYSDVMFYRYRWELCFETVRVYPLPLFVRIGHVWKHDSCK